MRLISWRGAITPLLLAALSPLSSFVQGIIVHVRFDGSLRPPTDPGHPTSSLGRLAACAASISIPAPRVSTKHSTDLATTDERVPLLLHSLGGKRLAASSTTTSGQVEYEGLLFALEGCISLLQTNALEISTLDVTTVLVQGDCKTLIEQMQGTAHPRKLQDYHHRAVSLIESSSQHQFQFEHIPRDENVECDRLSARILAEHQESEYRQMSCHLHDLLRQVQSLNEPASNESCVAVEQCQSQIQYILTRYLTEGTSCIPLSVRPSLYRTMARMAACTKDVATLLSIGTMYHMDVNAVLKSRPKVLSTSRTFDPSMSSVRSTTVSQNVEPIQEKHLVEAIAIQIIAFEALRRPKEIKNLERKHQWILEQFRIERQQIQSLLTTLSLEEDDVAQDAVWELAQRHEWPTTVNQWWAEAIVSQRWHETRSFWSSTIL